MRTFLGTVALLLAFSSVSRPQDVPLLYPTDKVDISGLVGLFAHTWCDATGDIYLEAWGDQTPITKLSSEGRALARFSLDSAPDPELKHGWLQSFSVDPWGNMFALVSNWNSGRAFIVEFDDEGKYEQTVELKAKGIFPYHIAVFPTHDFLLTGVKVGSTALPKGASQSNFFTGSFTTVFDPRGEVVKEVSFPEDTSKKEAAKDRGAGLSGPNSRDNAFAMVIGEGGAIPAPDGNVYLVRASQSPLVYVISSQGEVIRQMVLDPPAPGLSAWLRGMAAGKLILSFQKASRGPRHGVSVPAVTEWYSLYDAQTGEHLIDYKVSPELKGAFVCSTGNDFIFLANQDRRTFLIHAKPR